MQDKVMFKVGSFECEHPSQSWLSWYLKEHPAYFVLPVTSYLLWMNWKSRMLIETDKHWSPFNKNDKANYERYIGHICNPQDAF